MTKSNQSNPSPSPTPRTDDSVAFLQLFHPDRPWHLVAINDRSVAGKTLTEPEPAARWVEARQGKANLYYHVNQLTGPPLNKQAVKQELAAALYLHVDLDDPSEAALARLREYKLPPTAIVFSGGGHQAFWKLTAPATDLDAVEARNRQLALVLGADDCWNVNRIMRLPGTINVLNQKKRDAGRLPALAYLVEADWSRTYTLDQFTPAATVAVALDASTVTLPAELPLLDPDQVAGLDDATKALLRLGDDPERPRGKPKAHYPSRSEALFGALCRLVRADCNDATIAGLVLNPQLAISESALEKPKPRDYVARQIAKARGAVEANALFPDLTRNGQPRPTLANTKVALEALRVECRHDLFKLRHLVNGHALQEFVGELSDPALLRLRELVHERFGFDPNTETVHTAVLTLANHHRFHPVRDYLNSLTWDGVERLDTWLISYGEADDSEYVRSVGALVLTAAVRRVREPGCKFDEILVLENPEQGNNRSSALQMLAVRREWFSDNVPLGLNGKETIEALSGHWIVEASELHGMRTGDIEKIKAFASRDTDRGRMAYARTVTEARRQCVIIGTTNNEKYLRDLTGNRRFWPVGVGRFDLEALKRDLDQLWAEAAAREASGASIRLPERLWATAAAEQQKRVVENPFLSVLEQALRDLDNLIEEDGEKVGKPMEGKIATESVWALVGLRDHPGRRTQALIELLGAAMRELGWERPDDRQRVGGGKLGYCYVKGPKPHPLIEVEMIDMADGTAPRPVARYAGAPRKPPEPHQQY